MSFIRTGLRASSSRFTPSLRTFTTTIRTLEPEKGISIPEEKPNSVSPSNPFIDEKFPAIPYHRPLFSKQELSLLNPGDKNAVNPFELGKADVKEEDEFRWWKEKSKLRETDTPVSKFSGRSFKVVKGSDFFARYRDLKLVLNKAKLKSETAMRQYFEKPSQRKVRLAALRHRRRFANMVREKVKLVNLYKSRQ